MNGLRFFAEQTDRMVKNIAKKGLNTVTSVTSNFMKFGDMLRIDPKAQKIFMLSNEETKQKLYTQTLRNLQMLDFISLSLGVSGLTLMIIEVIFFSFLTLNKLALNNYFQKTINSPKNLWNKS